jgi:hypothetical protein
MSFSVEWSGSSPTVRCSYTPLNNSDSEIPNVLAILSMLTSYVL